jgi:hypothetical protein
VAASSGQGDAVAFTRLVADDQGNEVGHVIYDAFGQIVTNTIPLTLTDRLFTGQVFDASTGLYYYNARVRPVHSKPCENTGDEWRRGKPW